MSIDFSQKYDSKGLMETNVYINTLPSPVESEKKEFEVTSLLEVCTFGREKKSWGN